MQFSKSHRGYPPSHPWYYKLGGTPLPVEDIEPNLEAGPPELNKLPRYQPERSKFLRKLRSQYRAALAQEIRRYEELFLHGNAVISEWDRRNDNDPQCSSALDDALSLTHNHICYHKGALAAISKISTQEP